MDVECTMAKNEMRREKNAWISRASMDQMSEALDFL